MNKEKAQEIVQKLDRTRNLMVPSVGRWCIWPIVKTPLLFHLFHSNGRSSHSKKSNSNRDIKNYTSFLKESMLGIIQFLRHESWKNRPQLLFLTQSNSRREITPNDRFLDVFTDELITGGKLNLPVYVIENPTNWGHPNPTVGPIHLYGEPLLRLRKIMIKILRTNRRLRKAAEDLVRILGKTELPLDDDVVYGIVDHQLRKFEADRTIYRFILGHRKVRGFFIVDSDNYIGHIAAAKELFVPVFEFQHGQMGQEHIGYQWDRRLLKYKNNMPIPDFIFVYGHFWQSMLTKKGFWNNNEILPVGTARMDRFFKLRKKPSEKTSNRIKVIFTTQWPSREDAIAFWAKVLRKIKESGGLEIDLVIKIHQFEKQHISTYKVLEEKFPNDCKVIFDEDDTYSLLSKSDVHVSYFSSTLMESIAVGIPSVSICRACCPNGISGSMSMPEVRNFIYHLKNADELIAFLRNTKIGKGNKQESVDIYSKHFVKKTTSFINQLIN